MTHISKESRSYNPLLSFSGEMSQPSCRERHGQNEDIVQTIEPFVMMGWLCKEFSKNLMSWVPCSCQDLKGDLDDIDLMQIWCLKFCSWQRLNLCESPSSVNPYAVYINMQLLDGQAIVAIMQICIENVRIDGYRYLKRGITVWSNSSMNARSIVLNLIS